MLFLLNFMLNLGKIFGDPNAKVIKSLEPTIAGINSFEEKFKNLKDEEFAEITANFRGKLGVSKENDKFVNSKTQEEENKILDEIAAEAFAAIREAARRVLGQRHYDVQLVGGLILHRGEIAEMKTGEGKTLVATSPLYLNALTGRGVHLITVNDYLSRVGAGWMAPVYHFLGLSTAVIVHEAAYLYDPEFTDENQFDERLQHFKPITRRAAYLADVLYGTNNEFGFDYLKDNMVYAEEQMVQRDLNFAIVDEVDSILIDEARTPLIISAPAEKSTDKYYKFAQLVRLLEETKDYTVDEKLRAVSLTEAGISRMEKAQNVENLYISGGVKELHHLEQALKAEVLFRRDKDYVVKDGEVIIVDEFTGRMMYGRRYSEGLHQAIEAKEGAKIQRESRTLATITFQNYFRMYHKLAGMTGTAMTEAEEFYKIYKLDTVAIPTNKAVARKDKNDLIYATELGKYKAVIAEIKERHQKGQPVLVGTIFIEKNELLSELLEREGIKPQILNAKLHDKEAQIIAQAGQPGAVTIATNMAGRGVDIILGGTPFDQAAHDQVAAAGGLHVIGTERHESRRIDNQLRGRAGRQGDPGSSQFYVSMEDDLMRIFGGERMKGLMTTMKIPEDMPVENRMISKSIESAQKRVEGNNFDIRKNLVEYDDVINKHREAIYKRRRELLAVIGPDLKPVSAEAAEKLNQEILNSLEQEIEQVVSLHTQAEFIKDWNLAELYQTVKTMMPVPEQTKIDLEKLAGENHKLDKAKIRTMIIENLTAVAKDNYQQVVEIARAAGADWPRIAQSLLLRALDELWVEHLEMMDHLRHGIGLRGYGQRDPLVEYKKESFRLYHELNDLIAKQVAYTIFKVFDPSMMTIRYQEAPTEFSGKAKEVHQEAGVFGQATERQAPELSGKVKNEQGDKVGRNDPCPCGSGLKYKKCHGK